MFFFFNMVYFVTARASCSRTLSISVLSVDMDAMCHGSRMQPDQLRMFPYELSVFRPSLIFLGKSEETDSKYLKS